MFPFRHSGGAGSNLMKPSAEKKSELQETRSPEVFLSAKGGKEDARVMSPSRGKQASLTRELGLVDGIAFVVGSIIGSGIFATPGVVLLHAHSVGMSTICWFLGMVIAIGGALCYIEVGLLIPKTGGEFVYILEAYSFKKRSRMSEFMGSLLAFLFTWTAVTVLRPVGLAIITLTCAKYLIKPFYLSTEAPSTVAKPLALFIIVIITAVLSRSTKITAKLQTLLSSVKVLSCLFIVSLGVWRLIKTGEFHEDSRYPFAGSHLDTAEDFGALALALYAVLWTYDGWNNLNYAVEEQKNVEQNLPRALLIGLPIVAVCYIMVNLTFFSALSYYQIRSSVTVALPFGERVLGDAGVVIIPLIVALSTFGAGLSSLYTSSRLIFAAARDCQLPEALCGVHKTWSTPLMAVLFSSLVSSVLLLLGDVESLISGFSAAMWVFYGMVFFGVLIMRRTHKDEYRPFKVWLVLPVFMVGMSLCLVLLPIAVKPWPSMLAFLLILCGAPVYIFLVMERPFKLRPAVLDQWSSDASKYVNRMFNMESSRECPP